MHSAAALNSSDTAALQTDVKNLLSALEEDAEESDAAAPGELDDAHDDGGIDAADAYTMTGMLGMNEVTHDVERIEEVHDRERGGVNTGVLTKSTNTMPPVEKDAENSTDTLTDGSKPSAPADPDVG